jgi:uncharacterized FlgJ-related protein
MRLAILFAIISVQATSQTKDSVYNYLQQIDCKHPRIVAIQSVVECGHRYESYSARNRNNLFGLWNHSKQEFYVFDTWQESCDAYLTKVQYKLIEGEDYYEFLDRIGYATGARYIWKLKHTHL